MAPSTVTVRGVTVPSLGYGTWQVEGEAAYEGVLDALAGPLYYRGLFAHGPLDAAFVEATVDGVLAAHRP